MVSSDADARIRSHWGGTAFLLDVRSVDPKIRCIFLDLQLRACSVLSKLNSHDHFIFLENVKFKDKIKFQSI